MQTVDGYLREADSPPLSPIRPESVSILLTRQSNSLFKSLKLILKRSLRSLFYLSKYRAIVIVDHLRSRLEAPKIGQWCKYRVAYLFTIRFQR